MLNLVVVIFPGNSYIDFSKAKYVAEIGAGSGNLISLLKHHNKIKCMIDIDLPEMLLVCIVFLTKVFPEAKVLFPHEIDNKVTKNTLLNYDFMCVPVCETSQYNALHVQTLMYYNIHLNGQTLMHIMTTALSAHFSFL